MNKNGEYKKNEHAKKKKYIFRVTNVNLQTQTLHMMYF